ncbi:MAG: phenylacetate--CoA ligase [Clostridia bacterium]|nr:phenylacetate--CoA ligase [Oscillospiraceae bacterium]MBQ3763248.1 phenylacetate--CoA ligase [Clostridia bacterium]
MERYYQKEIETASRETIVSLQNERLVATVRRVYENVPFYRDKMIESGVTPDDIHSIDDLHKLPFSYKKDLRDTYPYGLFAVPMKDVVRIHASSGTTGKQIVVGYTKKDLDIWADCCARALTAAGCTDEDIVQVSYGYGLFTGGLGADGGAMRLGATAIPASTGNTQRQITIMHDFGSTVLCSTPSYALHLAEVLEASGMTKDDISLKAGIFGAEPWTNEMRRQIEEKLGLKAYDIYGLTEVMGPGVAFECCEQTGMHINEDHFIVEVIDPDTGEVLPEGTQGELVFTCITKEAFPILRYRTRDIGVITRAKCSCGRTLVKMTKPRGRTDDMLIIRGVNVFPSQIETVLLDQGYTANYQIVVDRANHTDSIEVQVEISNEIFSDTVRGLAQRAKELEAALRTLLGIGAKVSLVEPNTIPRSEGKAVRVIDKRKLLD